MKMITRSSGVPMISRTVRIMTLCSMAQGGGLCIMCQCVCHKTEECYDYENSIEKADDERQAEKRRKYEEYSITHKGAIV